MGIVLKLVGVIAVHAALFAAYPQTGPAGKIFPWISMPVCAVFLIMPGFKSVFMKMLPAPVKLAVDLVFLGVIALLVSLTMPQKDRVTVFEKVRAGSYPTFEEFRRGLVSLPRRTAAEDAAEAAVKAGEELGKAVEAAKKDLEKGGK